MLRADVHGSCVSFSILSKTDGVGYQRKMEGINNNLFFSHVNHMGAMTEPFPEKILETDFVKEFDNHSKRVIISNLNKDLFDNIEENTGDIILIDFYDSSRIHWPYRNGFFTHYARLDVVAPGFYARNAEKIGEPFKLSELSSSVIKELLDKYMEYIIGIYGYI